MDGRRWETCRDCGARMPVDPPDGRDDRSARVVLVECGVCRLPHAIRFAPGSAPLVVTLTVRQAAILSRVVRR